MTTDVLSKLAPHNGGAFPTHSDIHTEGGYQVRADVTDRNTIPMANRKEGMWVRLISDGLVYSLGAGLTNSDWTVVTFGGATPAAVFDAGTTSENIKSNRATVGSPIDNTKDGVVNLGSATSASSGATGNYSTISGGDVNNATADYSTVGGGSGNTCVGTSTTIAGGTINFAQQTADTVCGGNQNSSTGGYCFIGGGNINNCAGSHSVIAGGNQNTTGGDNSVIGGGTNNSTNNIVNTIAGGANNTISADNATICGGTNNTVSAGADYCVITGGYNNEALGNSSIVTGFEAKSDKSGQYVHSCGNNDAAAGGGSQFSRVVYFAQSITGATVNFKEGITNGNYTVQNGRNYALKITVMAAQSAAGAQVPELSTFDLLLSVDSAGAVTVIDSLASPAATPLTPTVASFGGGTYAIGYTTTTNTFLLNFTGVGGVTVRATATIEATELLYV